MNRHPVFIPPFISSILWLAFFSCLFSACQLTTSPKKGDTTSQHLSSDIILEINTLTYTIANEHDQFYSFMGVRSLTMVHLAIHDILNTLYPTFERYYFDQSPPELGADVTIAMTEATRILLTAAYPQRKDTIQAVCDSWISRIEPGEGQKPGLALGKAVANSSRT